MFQRTLAHLNQTPYTWAITGVAGFIGSHLLENLLRLNQTVVGLDNFSTGKQQNLNEVRTKVSEKQWSRFSLAHGDIRDIKQCQKILKGVDFVLHQAALGSVPKSIENPVEAHENNINGFFNILVAAKESHVKRVIYASSSAVYGDDSHLPKREDMIGTPQSPYALTKYVNELYAKNFSELYGLETIGLRYFNVFGPRQDPQGPYAAVIPRWFQAFCDNQPVEIYGDGETSRDFCFIDNIIQINILAALTDNGEAVNQVYNGALGTRTTLNELYQGLRELLIPHFPHLKFSQPIYKDFRKGDIRHSHADISNSKRLLGFEPTHNIQDGLLQSLEWYQKNLPSV